MNPIPHCPHARLGSLSAAQPGRVKSTDISALPPEANRNNDHHYSARNGPLPELSPKQEAVALALAAGRTLRQAASDSGAGERTVKTCLAHQPL